MPNYCNYTMKVTGRKENIKELLDILNADSDYKKYEFSYDRHFCRVFKAEPSENLSKLKPVDKRHDIYELFITGYCAWSVHSCMFGGEYSFYDNLYKKFGDKSKAITIDTEAKRLNLFIEIISEEEGEGFSEYYLLSPKGLLNKKIVKVSFLYNEDNELEKIIGGFGKYKFKKFTYKNFKKIKYELRSNKKNRKKRNKERLIM